MNYYPLHKNEISLPFIKLNVAINLQSIFFYVFFFFLFTEDDQVGQNKSQ